MKSAAALSWGKCRTFRSPISPASFWRFARSSSRNDLSSGESGPEFETFLPGILNPNHQSNTKTARTAIPVRSTLKRTRLNTPVQITNIVHIGNLFCAAVPGAHAFSRPGEAVFVIANFSVIVILVHLEEPVSAGHGNQHARRAH